MKIGGIVLAVLIVLALVVGVVVAAGPRGAVRQAAGPGMGMGCQMGMAGCRTRLLAALKLTDAQAADLKTIRDAFVANTKATREQLQAKMKEMPPLWAVDSPDAGAIKTLAGEIEALRAEIRDAAIDSAVDGLKVLTDKQREIVREFAKKCQMPCGCGCCVLGIDCPMGGACCGGGPGMGMAAGSGAGATAAPGKGGCCPGCPMMKK